MAYDPSVSYNAKKYSPYHLANRLKRLTKEEGVEDWRVQVALAVDVVNNTSFTLAALEGHRRPKKKRKRFKINTKGAFQNHDERRNKYADVAEMRK